MNKYSQDIRDICADYIRTKIREISESHYSAGWMSGIEYTVWNATQSPTRLLSEHEAKLLRAASEAIDGWIAWSGGGCKLKMNPLLPITTARKNKTKGAYWYRLNTIYRNSMQEMVARLLQQCDQIKTANRRLALAA